MTTCDCHRLFCSICYPVQPEDEADVTRRRAAADRQMGNAYLRHLGRCMWDTQYNADHYDPIARMTPEERGIKLDD